MRAKIISIVVAFFVAIILVSGALGRSDRIASSTGVLPPPQTTGSSGTSSSSTGSSTGSTTGSTTGYQVWPDVELVGVQEASGTTSYESEKFHAFRQQFTIQNIPANDSGVAVPGTNPQEYRDDNYTATLYSTCTSIDANSGEYYFTTSNQGETSTETTINDQKTGQNYYVRGYIVNNGDTLTNRIAGSSSGTYHLILGVQDVGDTYYYDSNGNKVDTLFNGTQYSEGTIVCNRFNLNSTSIDTRKTYGQPDLAGELPGDANAPANYINFYNWLYTGGSFVGNAPFVQTNDLSGTSRLQLYGANISYVKPIWVDLSLTRLGPPNANYNAAMDIAGYYIPATDPNYAVAPGNATWANAWNITGTGVVESTDLTINGTAPSPPLEYLNMTMPQPPQGTVNISVALANEATQLSNNFVGWQYFEDAYYQSQFPNAGLPTTDGIPRLWIVDETETNAWSTGTQG